MLWGLRCGMASVYFDIGTDQCVDMASRAIAIDSTYSAPYQLLGMQYRNFQNARDHYNQATIFQHVN